VMIVTRGKFGLNNFARACSAVKLRVRFKKNLYPGLIIKRDGSKRFEGGELKEIK
jgi:hypothetical protein